MLGLLLVSVVSVQIPTATKQDTSVHTAPPLADMLYSIFLFIACSKTIRR